MSTRRVRQLALPAILSLLAAAALPLDAAAPDEPKVEAKAELPWVYDIAKAGEQAKREKKDLFILFTGSDWCGFCKRLDKEVFTQIAFTKQFAPEFVFLFVDFPQGDAARAKVVDEEKSEALRDVHGIDGYPAVLLCDPEGRPYGRTGYQPIGAEKYAEHLAELRAGGEKVKALLANTDHARADELLIAAFPVLESQGLLALPAYEKYLEKAEGIESLRERAKAERSMAGLRILVSPKDRTPPDWEAVHRYLNEHDNLAGMELLNACWRCATQYLEPQKRYADAIALLRRMLADPILGERDDGKQAIHDTIAKYEKAMAGE